MFDPSSLTGRTASSIRSLAVKRRGITLAEAIMAVMLASILSVLVWSVFMPLLKQGQDIERNLLVTHSIVLLASRLEADVHAAETVRLDHEALVLTSHLSRNPWDKSYGEKQTIRYTHRKGERVHREVRCGPDGPISVEPLGGRAFARVDFRLEYQTPPGYALQGSASGSIPRLIRVTTEPLEPGAGSARIGPAVFTVEPCLIALDSSWVWNGF